LIWPSEKLTGLRAGWRKAPQVGMVGFVVGCLSPNHVVTGAPSTSSDSHNILLVKIDEDLCIPISEKGVKEYKTITSPPTARHTNAPKNNNTTVDERDEDEEEEEEEEEEKKREEQDPKDEQVTL
jgi:hypothetical protein